MLGRGKYLQPAKWSAGLATVLAVGLLVTGCATFPEVREANWTEQPQLSPQEGQVPPGGGGGGQREQGPSTPPRPPDGCKDYDQVVVATCLDSVSAIAALPDGESALVAERTTGRIVRVQKDKPAEQFASVPVDTAGDGGLTGLALSPSYAEDGLVFAYLTTRSDNRVVRIAKNDSAKPVLTGIPRGQRNNGGTISRDSSGALLVATGNAGNAGAATDSRSLAGKVLRINTSGKPASGNPDAATPIVGTGLTFPGGICSTSDGKTTWITDKGDQRDVLYRLTLGRPLGTPAWTWPDRPGVAGCAAYSDRLSVALTQGAGIFSLAVSKAGTFTGKPETLLKDTYGRLTAVDQGRDGITWFGTANKAGGKPVSSDDRVFVLPPPSGGGGGID